MCRVEIVLFILELQPRLHVSRVAVALLRSALVLQLHHHEIAAEDREGRPRDLDGGAASASWAHPVGSYTVLVLPTPAAAPPMARAQRSEHVRAKLTAPRLQVRAQPGQEAQVAPILMLLDVRRYRTFRFAWRSVQVLKWSPHLQPSGGATATAGCPRHSLPSKTGFGGADWQSGGA